MFKIYEHLIFRVPGNSFSNVQYLAQNINISSNPFFFSLTIETIPLVYCSL